MLSWAITKDHPNFAGKWYFLSHLEIVKDVTKEILRGNLIKLCGGQYYLVLNKISTLHFIF